MPHTTEEHTAENICTIVNQCKTELEEIGAKVQGLISDNEVKMISVREKFEKQEKDREHFLSCPGDPPHAIQLVIGDVLSSDFFKEVFSISIFIK